MSVKRQDAWTTEDDMALAEVTLRHIRDGGTQLSAFEEVARKLGRTPAACGFRWNSSVRKQYEGAIQVAKAHRQKRAVSRGTRLNSYDSVPSSLMMDSGVSDDAVDVLEQVFRLLRQHRGEVQALRRINKQLERQLEERTLQLEHLERENDVMRNQLRNAHSDYRTFSDDYRMLMKIMERARKMPMFPEGSPENRENGVSSGPLQMAPPMTAPPLANQSENQTEEGLLTLSEEVTCPG